MTNGERYEMTFYNASKGHEDTYVFRRTDTGWHFTFMAHFGPCNATGYPHFYNALDQDGIRQPTGLRDQLELLWNKAVKLSAEDIQSQFNTIGLTITKLEQTNRRPRIL